MSSWIAPLIAGGGVAVVSSALGAWYGAHLETRRWLREQRRVAYLEFLVVMTKRSVELAEMTPKDPPPTLSGEQTERVLGAIAGVQLVGPDEVRTQGDLVARSCLSGTDEDVRRAALNEFRKLSARQLRRR